MLAMISLNGSLAPMQKTQKHLRQKKLRNK